MLECAVVLLQLAIVLLILLPPKKHINAETITTADFIKFDDAQLPIVNVRIGDKEIPFLVDTGSSFSYLDTKLVEEVPHRKKPGSSYEIVGFGGKSESTSLEAVIDMQIGKATIRDFPISVLNLDGNLDHIKESSGIAIGGILGNDFLFCYGYKVDFRKKAIYRTWYTS